MIGRIAKDETPRARARFLARHPKAQLYAGFGDFAVFRMDVEGETHTYTLKGIARDQAEHLSRSRVDLLDAVGGGDGRR